MLFILMLVLGCGGDAGNADCDSAIYICDTWEWRLQQLEKDATMDTTDGVWIDQILLPGCWVPDDPRWRYSARTGGWTNGMNLVNVWTNEDGGSLHEEHFLPSFEAAEDGSYDILESLLTPGVSFSQAQSGQRTQLECGVHDTLPYATYAIRVYDESGNIADCALFSTEVNPNGAIAQSVSGERENAWPVSNPEQLNTVECDTWTLTMPSSGTE